MNRFLTILILHFCLRSNAQQPNLCQLFVNEYNQEIENLSFLRPAYAMTFTNHGIKYNKQ